MNKIVTTVIDDTKCTGCGLCVSVCPSGTISIQDGKAKVTGEESFSCGHCQAICPENAIVVGDIDPDNSKFSTFDFDDTWVPFGKFDPRLLTSFIASRRSTRNFLEKEVEIGKLNDLVKIGIMAPSGTNSQKWTFTIINSKSEFEKLRGGIGSFFVKLNKLAQNFFLRKVLALFGNKDLEIYWRDYFHSVVDALDLWEREKRDKLFHGATSAIIVGSGPGASCPAEDAMLATGNILLGAHAMGLGTCLIGYAVEAMKRDTSIQNKIGIPRDETIYAVIGIGYPSKLESYKRAAGRKKFTLRIR